MKIMIVEDEALLALELESELIAAGHEIVGHAADSASAFGIVDRHRPDFAFVDVQLQDGPTGIDIGRYLSDRDIPFVFVTGNLKRLPPGFVGAIGAIEKPYTMHGLKNALDYLEGKLAGRGESLRPPPSLVMPG